MPTRRLSAVVTAGILRRAYGSSSGEDTEAESEFQGAVEAVLG